MKKRDSVVIELTFDDVYHLHNICTHYYLTAALSRDDLPVIGKVSRAFDCVVDDVPVDLLYPGAIAFIIRDMQKADQCTEDWLRKRMINEGVGTVKPLTLTVPTDTRQEGSVSDEQ